MRRLVNWCVPATVAAAAAFLAPNRCQQSPNVESKRKRIATGNIKRVEHRSKSNKRFNRNNNNTNWVSFIVNETKRAADKQREWKKRRISKMFVIFYSINLIFSFPPSFRFSWHLRALTLRNCLRMGRNLWWVGAKRRTNKSAFNVK